MCFITFCESKTRLKRLPKVIELVYCILAMLAFHVFFSTVIYVRCFQDSCDYREASYDEAGRSKRHQLRSWWCWEFCVVKIDIRILSSGKFLLGINNIKEILSRQSEELPPKISQT